VVEEASIKQLSKVDRTDFTNRTDLSSTKEMIVAAPGRAGESLRISVDSCDSCDRRWPWCCAVEADPASAAGVAQFFN
jgi:hypothetical protein